MIAEVVLNSFSAATDNIYHYIIPPELTDVVCVGVRVMVPFGRGNKICEAYVIGIKNVSQYDKLKEIAYVEDSYLYFDSMAVELIKFMVHRYFCSYISAIKSVIPIGVGTVFKRKISLTGELSDENQSYIEHYVKAGEIYSHLLQGPMSYDKLSEHISSKNLTTILATMQKRGIINIEETTHSGLRDTVRKRVCLEIDFEELSSVIDSIAKKAPARARCLEVLGDERDMLLSELLEYASTSKATVDYLEKKGYVTVYEVVEREDIFDYSYEYSSHVLTEQQQNVCDAVLQSIRFSEKKTFLLKGVTGSGKTEVYLELIDNTVSLGREAIFLVPEISLTPQMVAQVSARFGDRVAVIHSSLTQKQRYEQWKRINEGEVDIVVGARSAVFSPFKNIGLIIVDEEHENTYKSEFTPKYDAVEIAKFRARQHGSVVLLASATPLVESRFRAHNGKYTLLNMSERVNKTPLPKTTVVDMRKEMAEGNMSIFSRHLIEEIASNLESGHQSILFLNRRGFSNFVSCRSCGFVPQCPNCNVSLTYHKSIDKLVCHYCDYAEKVYNVCPECSSKYIKHFGIGTQRVADEVGALFPTARIIRMDADTTSARFSHEKLLDAFRNKEADILIGTQMITKGLDFENVTLVGIVAADMSLNVDDYRAAERTFDLITQVTGRAGRGAVRGRAVIQTYNPDNETIMHAAKQDYDAFYDEEIELRKLLIYPPFCEFINFVFTSENREKAFNTAGRFRDALQKQLDSNDAILYSVGEAPLFRINNKYRYRFLIKTRYSAKLYDNIAALYKKMSSAKDSAQISIDVNPSNMY